MQSEVSAGLNAGPHVYSDEEAGLNLSELVGFIRAGWLTILVATIATLAIGLGYLWIVQPVYRADTLLQLDLKHKDPALGELASLLGNDTSALAEIQIIQSRAVLGEAVKRLNLDISATPNYFPIIGRGIARHASKSKLNSPFLGLSSWAWGGEQIVVTAFDVPAELLEQKFTLVAHEGGSYSLLDPEDNVIGNGKVGEPLQITYADAPLKLFVQRLVARPDTEFTLTRKTISSIAKGIDAGLNVFEPARDSGLISAKYENTNARKAAEILKAVVESYQRLNIEKKSLDAKKTLDFLNAQLPDIKSKLSTAEGNLTLYRQQQGSANLDQETQAILQQVVTLEQSKFDLEQKRELLNRLYTSQHPSVATLNSQIANIDSQLSVFSGKIKKLPKSQQEVLELQRELQVNTDLYSSVLNSIQQFQIAKEGQVGSVSIIDAPIIPRLPATPNRPMVLLGSIGLGILIGIGIVLVRHAMAIGISDPAVLEKEFSLPTFATIPFSEAQRKIVTRINKKEPGSILAFDVPGDISVESIRSLRTAIQFAFAGSNGNIISLSGPEPGVGKSFVSINLGAVLATSGKKVVVIDGDMRRGRLNAYINTKRTPGLSDFISGKIEISDVLNETAVQGLKVICTGTIPPNPSELLMAPRFEQLLEMLSREFDFVLVDTPPVLAVADAAIISKLCGVSLIVMKSGKHPVRLIAESLKRFQNAGVHISGAIFNQTSRASGYYGYGYGGYGSAYHYYSSGYSYKSLKE